MRSDKLYMFSDGTLTRLLTSLEDITNNIHMEYLPKKRWSTLEKKRAYIMIKAINKLLKERRIMRSLEKFIGLGIHSHDRARTGGIYPGTLDIPLDSVEVLRSFPEIHIVNDIVYHTCRAACEALGLLGYDVTRSCSDCNISRIANITYIYPYFFPSFISGDSDLEDYVLYELEGCLNHCSRSLTDFGLRLPPKHLMAVLRNRLLMEVESYDRRILANERDHLLPNLNDKQHYIFNFILDACFNNKQQLVFVYGHGRTGKTFLWKTVIYSLRSKGKTILAVASSDKILRDLLDEPNRLFVGKTDMLGGDFRQTLPVKKSAISEEIIQSSVAKSYMWRHFNIQYLTKNMCLNNQELQAVDREKVIAFAQWLLDVENGHNGTPDEYHPGKYLMD
ncbi:DNA helicase [Tanacetum coccineum]